MRAAVFREPGLIEVCEVAEPRPRAGEVIVEVHACGVCGTDIQLYRSGAYRQSAGVLHLNADGLEIPGHESAGRIIELGKDVRGWRIGDEVVTVTAGGGMAERLAAPVAHAMVRIPPGLGFAAAAITEPLADALQMIRLSQPRPGENIAVIGTGIVGLSLIELLHKRRAGYGKLLAIDLFDERLQLARELGATHTVHALKDDVVAKVGQYCGWSHMNLQRRSVPDVAVVFDCAGHASQRVIPAPLQQALAMLSRQGGRVISFGPYEGPIALDLIDLIHKQAQLIGSLGFVPQDLADALDLLSKGAIDHRRMTSCRLPLGRVGEGYAMQESGDVIKVIIEPQAG